MAHREAAGESARADRLTVRLIDGDPPPLPTFGAVVHTSVISGLEPPTPTMEPWRHLNG